MIDIAMFFAGYISLQRYAKNRYVIAIVCRFSIEITLMDFILSETICVCPVGFYSLHLIDTFPQKVLVNFPTLGASGEC